MSRTFPGMPLTISYHSAEEQVFVSQSEAAQVMNPFLPDMETFSPVSTSFLDSAIPVDEEEPWRERKQKIAHQRCLQHKYKKANEQMAMWRVHNKSLFNRVVSLIPSSDVDINASLKWTERKEFYEQNMAISFIRSYGVAMKKYNLKSGCFEDPEDVEAQNIASSQQNYVNIRKRVRITLTESVLPTLGLPNRQDPDNDDLQALVSGNFSLLHPISRQGSFDSAYFGYAYSESQIEDWLGVGHHLSHSEEVMNEVDEHDREFNKYA